VFLVVKLRINPAAQKIQRRELSIDETKAAVKYNGETDDKFLISKSEVEEFTNEEVVATSAHAPYWPSVRSTIQIPFDPLTETCARGFCRNENRHGGSS
jgi:translocation protein SEC63